MCKAGPHDVAPTASHSHRAPLPTGERAPDEAARQVDMHPAERPPLLVAYGDLPGGCAVARGYELKRSMPRAGSIPA
jgi:hypothetical protein